jgi:TolB-like protein/DNA-binding winged helix-turn-helix (wHTH) protein
MSRTDAEIVTKNSEIVELGEFVFVLKTKELQRVGGNTVELRSQSTEVLAFLANRIGELVTKDELINAVWEGTFVTDDSLVQCIGDIRRALEDETRKIVETIPRKGYRLNAVSRPKDLPGVQSTRWIIAAGIAIIAVAAVLWSVLWQPALPHGDEKPRIAVLAFDDFSVGQDEGYLSDAIAEGIITELARFKLMEVVARNSSFHFRGSETDIRKIGEALGAHYLLEGSQQKSGDKLKVTVQLIEASNGTHLWAHTYNQEIGDLFAVQDTIVKTVADRVGLHVEGPVPGTDPDRVTALNLHLQAVAIMRSNFNEQAISDVMALSEKAITADPNAVYGYVGLAHSYRAIGNFGWLGFPSDDAYALGLEAAATALKIDPDHPEVHYILARLHAEIPGHRKEAMASFEKAIDLNPSASNYLAASTTPLLYAGQTEEAIERLKQAMGIDPFHQSWYHWQMGWALWELNDCEGALASMLRMDKIRKGAHRMLAGIYACLGEVEKAQAAYGVFYEDSDEPTIAEQREEWKDIWTAPGSLDRWLEHMRIAGMDES